jgi:hypothetical protein
MEQVDIYEYVCEEIKPDVGFFYGEKSVSFWRKYSSGEKVVSFWRKSFIWEWESHLGLHRISFRHPITFYPINV